MRLLCVESTDPLHNLSYNLNTILSKNLYINYGYQLLYVCCNLAIIILTLFGRVHSQHCMSVFEKIQLLITLYSVLCQDEECAI